MAVAHLISNPFRGGVAKFTQCAAPNGKRTRISFPSCATISRQLFRESIPFRGRVMPGSAAAEGGRWRISLEAQSGNFDMPKMISDPVDS